MLSRPGACEELACLRSFPGDSDELVPGQGASDSVVTWASSSSKGPEFTKMPSVYHGPFTGPSRSAGNVVDPNKGLSATDMHISLFASVGVGTSSRLAAG